MIRLLNALLIIQKKISNKCIKIITFFKKKKQYYFDIKPKASSLDLNRAKIHIV